MVAERERGQLVAATESVLGDTLVGDHAADVTVLLVNNTIDFDDDGGMLRLGDEVLEYVGIDDDEDLVLLGSPTTAAHGDGAVVVRLPEVAEKKATLRVGSGSIEDVRVPSVWWPHVVAAISAPENTGVATVVKVAGEWVLEDVWGTPKQILGESITGTVPPEALTDGEPPAESPAVQVVKMVDTVALKLVTPLPANADPMSFDYYVNGVLFTTSPASMVVVPAKDTTGATVMPYDSDSEFWVVARDADGPCVTPGASAFGRPLRIAIGDLPQQVIDDIDAAGAAADAAQAAADAAAAEALAAAGVAEAAIKSYVNEYAVSGSETVAPTSGWSTATPTRTPGTFVWFRTVVTFGDDTTSTTSPALLTGNAGAPGSDGSSLFTWVKYADNASGGGMSDSPTGKTYIGMAFNKTTATESTTPGDYSWSLIKGDPGATGTGVSSVTPYYQTTNTGSAAPAVPSTATPPAPWVTTEPGYVAGKELWRTEKVAYSNGTFAYTAVTKVSAYTAAQNVMVAVDRANSKGTDLVANGTGSILNNTNFSQFAFDPSDAPTGAAGSFDPPMTAGIYTADDLLPVDPAKAFEFSYFVKQKGTPGAYMYAILSPYDNLKNVISPQQVSYWPGTLTSLAVELKAGDTVIQLATTPAVPFWGSPGKPAGGATHNRSIIWWDYTDANGKTWAPETYSRTGWSADQWADGGVDHTAKTITLNAPYAGPTRPAGTQLSNGTSGGSYIYPTGQANFIAATDWTRYTGIIKGVATNGAVPAFANGWPNPVAYVKVGWLLNRTSTGATAVGSRHSIAGVSFSDASAAASAATAAQSTANAKGKVIIQSAAPAAADQLVQNLWIDTTGGANTPKRWSGSAWVAVTDKAATDAAAAAVAAQNTANAAATAAANAQTSADGKTKVVYSGADPSSPGSYGLDDTWFKFTGGLVVGQWRHNGTAWIPVALDVVTIANLNAGSALVGFLDVAELIDAKAISTDKLEAEFIEASEVYSQSGYFGSVSANQITTGEINAAIAMLSKLGVGQFIDIDGSSPTESSIIIWADAERTEPLVALRSTGDGLFTGTIRANSATIKALTVTGDSLISSGGGFTLEIGVASPVDTPTLVASTVQSAWPALQPKAIQRGFIHDPVADQFLRLTVPDTVGTGSLAGKCKVEVISPAGAVVSTITLANVTGSDFSERDMQGVLRLGGYIYSLVSEEFTSGGTSLTRWTICRWNATTGAYDGRGVWNIEANGSSTVNEVVNACFGVDETGAAVLVWSKNDLEDGLTTATVQVKPIAGYNPDGGRTAVDLPWTRSPFSGVPIGGFYATNSNSKFLGVAPTTRAWALVLSGKIAMFNGATPTHTTTYSFNLNGNPSPWQESWAAFRSNSWYSLGQTSLHKYADYRPETTAWLSYTYSDGTYTTLPSPKGTIVVPVRRFVSPSISPAPAGVTQRRVWIGTGATEPANSAMWGANAATTLPAAIDITQWLAANTAHPPTVATFPSGAPGYIRSRNGLFEALASGVVKVASPTAAEHAVNRAYLEAEIADVTESAGTYYNWTDIPTSAFKNYGVTGDRPRFRVRHGQLEIRGVVSPNAAANVTAVNGTSVVANCLLGTLPTAIVDRIDLAEPMMWICQGSGTATWALRLADNGDLHLYRYSGTANTGTYMPFNQFFGLEDAA